MKIRQSTRSNPLSLSPTLYSNAGMTHALGSPYWRDLFDIVIVQAMKPSFYSNSDRLDNNPVVHYDNIAATG